MPASGPGCDEVRQEEKHRAALNGGHRGGGDHGDEEKTAMVGPRGANGRYSPPQVPPCVQAVGWYISDLQRGARRDDGMT